MSGNPNSNSLLPFSLPEDQCCKGHENFASWEIYMLAHGGLRGLTNYWENKINIPTDPTNVSEIPDVSATAPTTASPTSMPLHSLTPTFLEYQLRESVALSSILINLVDIPGQASIPKESPMKPGPYLRSNTGNQVRELGI